MGKCPVFIIETVQPAAVGTEPENTAGTGINVVDNIVGQAVGPGICLYFIVFQAIQTFIGADPQPVFAVFGNGENKIIGKTVLDGIGKKCVIFFMKTDQAAAVSAYPEVTGVIVVQGVDGIRRETVLPGVGKKSVFAGVIKA